MRSFTFRNSRTVQISLTAGALALLAALYVPNRSAAPPPAPARASEVAGNWKDAACALPLHHLRRIRQGDYRGRTSELIFVPRYPNFAGNFEVTTHSGPWDYLQRVPMAFYGPGFIRPQGRIALQRNTTVADIAPTLAELLDIDWPADRPGQPVTEALLPRGQRSDELRMILVVVWDGGGWNVLNRWPDAWPFLEDLMAKGTTVTNAIVGSSPTVTPAIHATIGTGAWPNQHGIVDIPLRIGTKVAQAYPNHSPKYLELPTLADLYDPTTGNTAEVGMLAEMDWHLGMMGHGAYLSGGDKDIAVLTHNGHLKTNRDYYRLPDYLKDVGGLEQDARMLDASDGEVDRAWMDHIALYRDNRLKLTPLWTVYQTRLLKKLLTVEQFGRDSTPDLFFTNYKEVDLLGHVWNMLNPEMRETLRVTDDELKELVTWLNNWVGPERWVLALTADHGQGPDPRRFGAWPINTEEVKKDIAVRFRVSATSLIEATRVSGLWLNPRTLAEHNLTVEDIADFLVDYRLEDNVQKGQTVPRQYRKRMNERLFAAAFPSARLDEIWTCASTSG